MAKIEIYTKAGCSFCFNTKKLLEEKGVEYTEMHVDKDPSLLEKMQVLSHGKRSLPQIFINDKSIGGFDSLSELNRKGQLDVLLKDENH